MAFEDDIIAAWRTVNSLRFAPEHEISAMRTALCEIRDNLDEILA
jgi:hypothetical protein